MNFFSMVIGVVVLITDSGVSSAQSLSTPPPLPQPSTQPPAPIESSRPGPADLGQRQTVEGVVQSVKGSTMTVKSNTGRTIVVDLSKINEKVYQITSKGETVTVIGFIEPGSDRLTAQAVIGSLKDDRAPAALPSDVERGR